MSAPIHLVLRSYGGDNQKRRPPYYSKLLALVSFIRATTRVPDADVVFLNDGPIPAPHLHLMEQFGTVVQIPGGPVGMRRSYWLAVTLPERNPDWGNEDILSLNEDDYLFRSEAFSHLRQAADGLPEASYFSVYGPKPDYSRSDVRASFSLPHGWTPAPDHEVAGAGWFNQPGITSTFAGRVGAFRKDKWVFRHCMIPFRKRFLDHETCLIYQGYVPYRGLDIVTGLPGDFVPGVRGVARTAVLIPFRIALNAHARMHHEHHLLYCLNPNDATHMDAPAISPDRNWADEAALVVAWAKEQGWSDIASQLENAMRKGNPQP